MESVKKPHKTPKKETLKLTHIKTEFIKDDSIQRSKYHSSVLYKDNIITMGGLNSQGQYCGTQLRIYNITNNKWTSQDIV